MDFLYCSNTLGWCSISSYANCFFVPASEFELNLDVHFSSIRLQQGAHFFREEPGHLGVKEETAYESTRCCYCSKFASLLLWQQKRAFKFLLPSPDIPVEARGQWKFWGPVLHPAVPEWGQNRGLFGPWPAGHCPPPPVWPPLLPPGTERGSSRGSPAGGRAAGFEHKRWAEPHRRWNKRVTCLFPPAFTMAMMTFSVAMKGSSWRMCLSMTLG